MLSRISASGRPAEMDPNQGDAPIFRQITAMAMADLRQITAWAAAMRGTAQVLRWQSAELRERAAAARARAGALRDRSARARSGGGKAPAQGQPREPS